MCLAVLFDSNGVVHQRAIGVLCNLLYNHDLDVRYTDPEIKVSYFLLCLFVLPNQHCTKIPQD
jgi:hypothetical protein